MLAAESGDDAIASTERLIASTTNVVESRNNRVMRKPRISMCR